MDNNNQFLLFEEQEPEPKEPEKTEREKELNLLYEKIRVW